MECEGGIFNAGPARLTSVAVHQPSATDRRIDPCLLAVILFLFCTQVVGLRFLVFSPACHVLYLFYLAPVDCHALSPWVLHSFFLPTKQAAAVSASANTD